VVINVKGAGDQVAELEEAQLETVRESLRKAAEIRDKRQLWFAVRDIFTLLTMIVSPEIMVRTTYEH
jgi:hypothetical protein